MKFVFRVLSSNIKNNVYTLKNGTQYYQIPLVQMQNDYEKSTYIAVPINKTYKKGDSLYVVLDSNSKRKDIFLMNSNSINDEEALTLINNDFINYIMDENYNHTLSHVANNLMPVGVEAIGMENQTYVDKWSSTVNSLISKFGIELQSLNPLTTNKLYPFHYTNFIEHKFIHEYRSNIIMFTLAFDKNYEFNKDIIYYRKNDNLIPMYEAINDEHFYIKCDAKDKANQVTKPFLRSFNDHGLAKEVIQFMQEDEIYREQIYDLYQKIREELQIENILKSDSQHKEKSKLYFIPALNSTRAINIRKDKEMGKDISEKEQEYLNQHLQERMELLVKLYDENKISYFTSDDLIISEDKLVINSALKKVIDLKIEDLTYNKDTKTLYNIIDFNGKEIYTPILEVVSKEQIKKLKDEIYDKWISQKKRKSR